MEVTDEKISDCVRVQLGMWCKDEGGVWRFNVSKERTGKSIRFREGDGVEAAKEKVMQAWNIDRTSEKVELTYEMPEWMDVDGSVKPVPIHIVTDDNMDKFLAMLVPIMDEFAFAEVMSKKDVETEMQRRADKAAIDDIICTQKAREHVSDSGDGLLGWVGHSYGAGGFATLSAAMRHYREAAQADRRNRSPVTGASSGEQTEDAEPLNQYFPSPAEPATAAGNKQRHRPTCGRYCCRNDTLVKLARTNFCLASV
ncbi:unnamed protein product [Arabidopsis halleri]